jgi:hypothetical protein
MIEVSQSYPDTGIVVVRCQGGDLSERMFFTLNTRAPTSEWVFACCTEEQLEKLPLHGLERRFSAAHEQGELQRRPSRPFTQRIGSGLLPLYPPPLLAETLPSSPARDLPMPPPQFSRRDAMSNKSHESQPT